MIMLSAEKSIKQISWVLAILQSFKADWVWAKIIRLNIKYAGKNQFLIQSKFLKNLKLVTS